MNKQFFCRKNRRKSQKIAENRRKSQTEPWYNVFEEICKDMRLPSSMLFGEQLEGSFVYIPLTIKKKWIKSIN